MSSPSRPDPGLLAALSEVGGSLLGALHHRLELAGLELDEARERLLPTLAAALAVVLLFGGATAALTAWVAVALWPAWGAWVLLGIAVVYALAGALALQWLRARLRRAPPLLADTLAELARDAAALRGRAG